MTTVASSIYGRRPNLIVTVLLREMGIPHKPGGKFFLRNEGELEYIYADFVRRAREIRASLHPDRPGGDEVKFQTFSANVDAVTRSFRRNGIDREDALTLHRRKEENRARQKAKDDTAEARRHRYATTISWRMLHPEVYKKIQQACRDRRKLAQAA